MKNPIAVLSTPKGKITIELYPNYAPNAVASFIYCVNEAMYKNRVIKRIVPQFVLQPSFHYFDEKRCDFMLEGEFSQNGFNNPLTFEKGIVALAGDGEKYSHGSEFFICLSDEKVTKLQGKFTAFGKVIDGYEEVDRIENVPTKPVKVEGMNATINQPIEDEIMLDITVETFGVEYPKPVIAKYDSE